MSVDTLSGLLDGPRASGAFLLRTVLAPPWSMRVADRAPVTLLSVTRGRAWLRPCGEDGTEARPLEVGDVALVRGPEPYTVSSEPALEPTVVIHPGRRTTTVAGDDLCAPWSSGVRTWGTGTGDDRDHVMLVGTYDGQSGAGGRLLSALPPRLVLSPDSGQAALLTLLQREIELDRPGQDVVLDRLLDLLLTTVLRAWFARPDSDTPAWYRARADPVVGAALRLLHDEPAHPWTVAALAARVGASRSALARRFTLLVGEPPMAHLTAWRLALAADLLCERSEPPLDAVARHVGYGTSFALSRAFKRGYGVSPRQYRHTRQG